jgi:hypothetical protein
MPKYYCDYCDVFLSHDSQNGRKEHNHGRKHQENVRMFYAEFLSTHVQVPGPSPLTFMPLPESAKAAAAKAAAAKAAAGSGKSPLSRSSLVFRVRRASHLVRDSESLRASAVCATHTTFHML